MISKEEIENNIKEKDSSVVETEKIIIEIPKNTNYLSLVCFFTDKDGFNVNNQILGIKPIKERKEELEQLESYKQKLIEKLEEDIEDKIKEEKEECRLAKDKERLKRHAYTKEILEEILENLK